MKEKYNVLVVGAEEELLHSMQNLLEPETFEIVSTQDSLDAYEKVKNYKYHIVLIDIDIADMDGIELLKQIKSYDALTQIIMMTEHSTMDRILCSLEYGANDYITKPTENTEKVLKLIDYSINKLERWRASILELVK